MRRAFSPQKRWDPDLPGPSTQAGMRRAFGPQGLAGPCPSEIRLRDNGSIQNLMQADKANSGKCPLHLISDLKQKTRFSMSHQISPAGSALHSSSILTNKKSANGSTHTRSTRRHERQRRTAYQINTKARAPVPHRILDQNHATNASAAPHTRSESYRKAPTARRMPDQHQSTSANGAPHTSLGRRPRS